MYKAVYLAKRNPSISAEDFPERWRQHSLLAKATPGTYGFFVNVRQCCRMLDADFPPDASQEYDAVALLGLRDLDAATQIWEQPATKEVMQPDELRVFSRLVVECWMVTEEVVLRPGPPDGVVVLRFLKRLPGMDAMDFRERLAVTLATIEKEGSRGELVQRYVQNYVVQPPPPGFEYDAITETWFSGVDDARLYYADVQRQQRVTADLADYCDVGAGITMTTHVTFAKG